MSAWRLRALGDADNGLLLVATLENLNWGGPRFTEQDVRERAEFRHYTTLRLDRGDFGWVADAGGDAVGVAWAQFLPAESPGYGFVDEFSPELSLWVRDDRRQQGIGRTLLRRMRDTANERGVGRLSLSVEPENVARHLYSAEGFVPVVGREADGVMIWPG